MKHIDKKKILKCFWRFFLIHVHLFTFITKAKVENPRDIMARDTKMSDDTEVVTESGKEEDTNGHDVPEPSFNNGEVNLMWAVTNRLTDIGLVHKCHQSTSRALSTIIGTLTLFTVWTVL